MTLWAWLLAGGIALAWLLLRAARPDPDLAGLPPGADPELLRELVARGHKIEAIRRYRDAHPQLDLKEAKEAVEALGEGRAPATIPPPTFADGEVESLVRQDRL